MFQNTVLGGGGLLLYPGNVGTLAEALHTKLVAVGIELLFGFLEVGGKLASLGTHLVEAERQLCAAHMVEGLGIGSNGLLGLLPPRVDLT